MFVRSPTGVGGLVPYSGQNALPFRGAFLYFGSSLYILRLESALRSSRHRLRFATSMWVSIGLSTLICRWEPTLRRRQRAASRRPTALRQIRCVLRSLSSSTIKTLVVSLVLSRLDYCNVALTAFLDPLRCHQSVISNAAARVISGLPRSAHINTTYIILPEASVVSSTSSTNGLIVSRHRWWRSWVCGRRR